MILIVAACSMTALVRPEIGMYCFVWLSFFSPSSMTWGAQELPFAQIVAVGTMAGFLFWREKKRFPFQRESVLLLALWIMFYISTTFALRPNSAFDKFKYISKVLIMVFLCTAIIKNEKSLLVLLRIIAVSLGFFGLKGGVWAIKTGGTYEVYGPLMSWLFANNSIGLALSMNIPILYYLSKIDPNKWCKRLYALMIVFSFPAIICTFSRGAWLGGGIVAFLILARHRKRILLVPAAIVLSGIALLMFSDSIPERVTGRYGQLVNYEEEGSAESRFWNWEFCKRVGIANPFTGAGFEYYTRDAYLMYYPEFIKRWPGKVWNCHSTWYSIFSEHGFPGLIIWVSLMISSLITLRNMRRYGKTNPGKFHYTHYADMLEGGLFAFMVVGSFIDAAYYEIYYYFIAIIIIINAQVKDDSHHHPNVGIPDPVNVHPDQSRLRTV